MNNDAWNWSDIRIFLAVVRCGSTLAAAKSLGMAQPTVTRRIEVLEHQTGLSLFDRDTRGSHPTAAAKALMPAAEAMEATAAGFATAVAGQTAIKPIRITAYSANFSPRITAIFSDFSIRTPGVSFEFLPSTHVLDLCGGEADIALRLTREPPDDRLIQRKISRAQFTLYGSRAYAEAHGLPSSLDEMSTHRFVSFARDDVPKRFHNWLLRHVTPDRIVATFHEVGMMDAAIKAGQGLGLMNMRLAADEPDLIACMEPIEELAADHLILASPEAHRRPEVRAFLAFFAPRYAALFK